MANLPSAKTRKYYADKIGSALGKSVEGFIEAGRWLNEAEKELGDDFTKMVEGDLKMSRQTAFRLKAISNHAIVSNVTHVQHLPASWGTLYELTKVEPKLLTAAIKDGRVNPKMERKEVAALLPGKPNAKAATKTVRPRKNSADTEAAAAALVLDEGKSLEQAAKETGVGSVQVMKIAVATEKGRREILAAPPVDTNTLSMTAQEKLALAIKHATRKLEIDIEKRIHEENLKWWKDQLDQYTENARHYEAVLKVRTGIMKKADYRSILSCLHPDRVQDEELKRRYEHAFNIFTKLEKMMLDEKESPTPSSGLPKTVEELLQRKAQYQAQRSAERASKRGGNVPTTRH